MSLILGIDTGGTYTDAVIFDSENKSVLCKAKAYTTKHDLLIGIKNCLDELGKDELSQVGLTCLSTTLATNAIVEDRGGRVGLIYCGGTIDVKTPQCISVEVQGKLDIRGKVLEDLNESEIRDAVNHLLSQEVEAIAVSGFASVRNPIHELEIREIIHSMRTLPVVCAHDLSSKLGFNERSTTAVLNAKLLPIISNLIKASRDILIEKGLDTKIMVVKGNGSLMDESSALNKPIETILSGPAASVIGAKFLSGKDNALIIDIGGTTTDIANLENGDVIIRKDGAKVGGWHTQVKAADIRTFGLGGDSYIQLDSQARVKIGPLRVHPLSRIATKYPYLTAELSSLAHNTGFELYAEQEIDCFFNPKTEKSVALVGRDAEIVELLNGRPHSARYLASALDTDIELLGLSSLVERGILERASLTPTDVLLYLGKYNIGNSEIVESAIRYLAQKLGMGEEDFAKYLLSCIEKEFVLACVQSAIEFDQHDFDMKNNSVAAYFFNASFDSNHNGLLSTQLQLNKPIVAVGAPAEAWVKELSLHLNTQDCVPQHAEVANAVGAAIGQIIEKAEALIRPIKNNKVFCLHLPKLKREFESIEEAKSFAVEVLRAYVINRVMEQCNNVIQSYESVDDVYIGASHVNEKVYIETKIIATAIGQPD